MATYYLDAKNGTDSAGTSGATGAPWKSMEYAHSRISAGDTVKLRGNNTDSTTFYKGVSNTLVVTKANTTWVADSGHQPTFDSGWGRHLLRPMSGHPFSNMYTHEMPDNYGSNAGKWSNGQTAYTVVGKNSRFAKWIGVQATGVTFDGLIFQNMDRNVIGFSEGGDQGTVQNCRFFWFFRQAIIAKFACGVTIDSCSFIHGTLMRMRAHPDGGGANAWFNFFPVKYTEGKLTPDGYCGVVRNCYSAYTHGDGMLIQESPGDNAWFLFEGNVLHDGEGFYPVASTHVIFRRNVVYNTENTQQYKAGFSPGTSGGEPGYLNKDEVASFRDLRRGGSAHFNVANNLFVNARGPIWVYQKVTPDKAAKFGLVPDNANLYFGFNTIVLPSTIHSISVRPTQVPGSKFGPLVIENNVIHATNYDATPGSQGGSIKRDVVYRNNAQLTARAGFIDAVVASSAAMKLGDPGATVRSVNNCPSSPVLVGGVERYQNWSDLQFRNNYGLWMQTQTDIDLRNYRPESDSPLVDAARPRSPTTYAGANTGNTLTIPVDAYNRDLWSTDTGTRTTIGCLEWDSVPGEEGSEETVTAYYSATPVTGLAPLTVAFTDASTHDSSPITSRSWAFGDGVGTSTATNPSYIYTTAGVYYATLTVNSSSTGLSDSYTGPAITVLSAPPPPPPPPDGDGDGADVAVCVATGTMPTSNGELLIEGDLYDLEPKAAELFVVGVTADDTVTAHSMLGIGLTDGTTSFACAIYSKDNISSSTNARNKRRWTSAKALLLCDEDGAVLASGVFNRWEANGVVLDITWVGTPAAYKVTALLHGGDNCQAAVRLGQFGNVDTTSTVTCGFAPQVVKCYATFGAADTANNDNILSMGVGNSSGAQYVVDRRVTYYSVLQFATVRLAARIATSRYAAGERGNVSISSWTETGITLLTTYDNINSYGGLLLLNYGTTRTAVGLLTVPATAGTAQANITWEPQAVQQLMSFVSSVNSEVNDTNSGTIGVHLHDRTGASYSVETGSKGFIGTTNEASLRTTDVRLVSAGDFSDVIVGAAALTTTGYEVELSATHTKNVPWPYVAVEKAQITDDPNPVVVTAAFTMLGDNPGIAPLMVQFQDASTGTNPIVAWLWDFGDGQQSTEQHPVHVYETPGTYTVTLYVTDSLSNSDELEEVDYITVNAGMALANPIEIVVGPLIAARDVGEVDITQTFAERDLTAPTDNDGTIQFRPLIHSALEFANGWAIVISDDGTAVQLRNPDGDLFDFDVTAV